MLSPAGKRADLFQIVSFRRPFCLCSGTVVSVDRPPVLPQNPSDTICIVWILPSLVARKRFSAISTPFLYYPEEREAKLDPLGAASLVAAAAAARALALPRLLHAMDHIRKRANNDSSHNNQLNVHIFLPLCRHGMKRPLYALAIRVWARYFYTNIEIHCQVNADFFHPPSPHPREVSRQPKHTGKHNCAASLYPFLQLSPRKTERLFLITKAERMKELLATLHLNRLKKINMFRKAPIRFHFTFSKGVVAR